jgi:two-component system nitrate/nitrite response regulator NarL
MRRTSVVIADRHPVVLQGLMNALGAQSGFEVVACCSDGTTCIEAIRSLVPDIAILDVSMPGLTGLEILTVANSESLSTRLVFFTASVEDRELVRSAAAGAYGVILKDVTLEILVQSLRQVADGQRLLPLTSSDQAVPRERRNIAITENVLTVLTDRERQIMFLVSEGLSNKEIGRRLNIADGTIKVHLHHVYQKLEISNRTALAALAVSHNDLGRRIYAIERRRLSRAKVAQPAKVLAGNAAGAHDCTVENLNTLGACISFDATALTELPHEFDLTYNCHSYRHCEVIWQNGGVGRVGVSWKTC